jgi:hypothetical protein
MFWDDTDVMKYLGDLEGVFVVEGVFVLQRILAAFVVNRLTRRTLFLSLGLHHRSALAVGLQTHRVEQLVRKVAGCAVVVVSRGLAHLASKRFQRLDTALEEQPVDVRVERLTQVMVDQSIKPGNQAILSDGRLCVAKLFRDQWPALSLSL